MRRGQVAVAVERLAVRQRQRSPRGPGVGQPHPSAEVLPEVHHEGLPAAYRPDGRRADLLDSPDRRRDGADDGDIHITCDGGLPGAAAGHPIQARIAHVRIVHARIVQIRIIQGQVVYGRLARAAVLSLAAYEVGRGDMRRRHAPARAGARRHLPAGSGPHLELRAQREVPAVLVRGPRQPDLAPVPAVGQQDREHVPPRRHQGRDVVGLVLHPGAVLGVAGCELDVADPPSVQERLVQAEGRHVQPGRAGRGGLEGRPEPVRRPMPGRGPLILHHADPPRRPVRLVQQARLEPDGIAPPALAQIGPHLDPGLGAAPGPVEDRQPDERLDPAVHPPGVETVVGAHPVGVLYRRPVRQPPAQGGLVPAARGVPADDLSPYGGPHEHRPRRP